MPLQAQWLPIYNTREGSRNVFVSETSRPVLGPTQPPVQRVPGCFRVWVYGRGMTVATEFHLVFRLKMSGAVPLLPPYASTGWTATPSPP